MYGLNAAWAGINCAKADGAKKATLRMGRQERAALYERISITTPFFPA